jgi:hypothetical protein
MYRTRFPGHAGALCGAPEVGVEVRRAGVERAEPFFSISHSALQRAAKSRIASRSSSMVTLAASAVRREQSRLAHKAQQPLAGDAEAVAYGHRILRAKAGDGSNPGAVVNAEKADRLLVLLCHK